MEISGQAVLLRVFVGESDKLGHLPLYEVIVKQARQADLAGATVLKGVTGFGASARIRTQKILDLSSDLPMVVEIVDEAEKIAAFQSVLSELFDRAGCGALVTLENIRIVHYLPGKKD
jgi:PII-like signaling protein